jgi:hypothetical protein
MGKKLLEIMADKIRFKHYSISTEKTYVHWKRYGEIGKRVFTKTLFCKPLHHMHKALYHFCIR